jgi:large subunit ribosomal protein L9
MDDYRSELMQVLMRKDVERLGTIGDVVNVKSGYARNYLLPQGLAVSITPGNLRRVEILKVRASEERKARDAEVAALAENLKAVSVTIAAKANEEGHLFGSVSAAKVAEVLQAEGYKVDEKMVQLDEPLREVGVVDVPLRITAEIVTTCKVWIVAE